MGKLFRPHRLLLITEVKSLFTIALYLYELGQKIKFFSINLRFSHNPHTIRDGAEITSSSWCSDLGEKHQD